jgi:trans-2,3-dihydro-3-hydroxyanthranilate isomerase
VTSLRYRIVDVFTDRPLAGNGLGVVLDPCPEEFMQPLAREFNLSETTFPVITGPGHYDVRIFTPSNEMPYAGHPTIGTAWALGPGAWTQTSPGAVVTVESDELGAQMSQPDPVLEEVDASALSAALGIRKADVAWRSTAGGLVHLIVPTGAPIAGVKPDWVALHAAATDLRAGGGAAVVKPIDDRTLHVRAFFPGFGIDEDPGTGSLAGPIGILAGRLWGTATDLTIQQGDEMGRPCRIQVHAEPGAIRVGGRVTMSAEGVFSL